MIVVDDASTDDTVDIVKRCDSRGIPVRIIQNQKNSGGPARPFNTGIAAASGPLIATLEQDDLWHKDKLALSRMAFEACPEAGLVYADNRSFETETPAVPAEALGNDTRPQLVPAD